MSGKFYIKILFLAGLLCSLWFGGVAIATAPDALGAATYEASGSEFYRQGDFFSAITQWEQALKASSSNRSRRASVEINLAQAYQQVGDLKKSLTFWERAIDDYRQMGERMLLGRTLIEEAQTIMRSGQLSQALAILCGTEVVGREDILAACKADSAMDIATKEKDLQGSAAALGSLGEAYRLRGEYGSALAYLQASLKIATEIDNPVYRSSALNSLGNADVSLARISYRRANSALHRGDDEQAEFLTSQASSYDSQALRYFHDSLKIALIHNDIPGQLRALINSILPLYRINASLEAARSWQQAHEVLHSLPDSQFKVMAAIDLVHLIQPVNNIDGNSSSSACLAPEYRSEAVQVLSEAVSAALNIKDPRAKSFALGEMGHIYECSRDYFQALDFTRQAMWSAQLSLAKDSLYLWQWQAGRILLAQNRTLLAIEVMSQARRTLEDIRGDILNANRDVQFDFRDAVEPLYRNLAQLSLDAADSPSISPVDRNKELAVALDIIDSLKLAELQNYFGNDCVITAAKNSERDLVKRKQTAALANVQLEISEVQTLLPGSSQLLDDNFTRERLQQELTSAFYPVIHIATHGEFGEEPTDTFLVAGDNTKITIDDLNAVINNSYEKSATNRVELLVLTACQTAVGDERAALGMAGVAVSSGVRSALATLWEVQDAPTAELIAKFYASLHDPDVSLSEALRTAQLAFISAGGIKANPAYWSGFILIGNWL